MAKTKRRRPRKVAAKATRTSKASPRKRTAARKLTAAKRSTRSAPRKVAKKAKRVRSPSIKAAAKRVLISAGRTVKALANAGTAQAEHAGRNVLARGARAAAAGVQQGAQSAGNLTASTLESIADRVEPHGS